MYYIKLLAGFPVQIQTEYPEVEGWKPQWCTDGRNGWVSSRDFKTMEEVERLALYVTAMTGKVYVAVDSTEYVYPRYDIVEVPKVGDKVSYGFNGDYYPDGEVVKVSKTLQITTSTGKVYRRKGQRACWLQPGGTWGLVGGHIDERNPHF